MVFVCFAYLFDFSLFRVLFVSVWFGIAMVLVSYVFASTGVFLGVV